MTETVDIGSEWLARKDVFALSPGPRHWEIAGRLLLDAQARGPLAMDGHIAAHAIEPGAALATTYRDFARFTGLRTRLVRSHSKARVCWLFETTGPDNQHGPRAGRDLFRYG